MRGRDGWRGRGRRAWLAEADRDHGEDVCAVSRWPGPVADRAPLSIPVPQLALHGLGGTRGALGHRHRPVGHQGQAARRADLRVDGRPYTQQGALLHARGWGHGRGPGRRCRGAGESGILSRSFCCVRRPLLAPPHLLRMGGRGGQSSGGCSRGRGTCHRHLR